MSKSKINIMLQIMVLEFLRAFLRLFCRMLSLGIGKQSAQING